MKKIFLSMLAIVGMIATSCENTPEIGAGVNGQTVDVVVNVGTPQITNRSFSDGFTATSLQYAVYNENGAILNPLTVTDAEINGSTTVELKLVTGNKYWVLFWADAGADSPYTVDLASKTMSVSYDGAVCSDESRDAFYCYQPIEVTGAMTVNAELKRPFAQINIGTNDYAKAASAGYAVSHAKFNTKAYTTLDLVNGNVANLVDVDFAYAAVPTAETFPVTGYEYMAMAYVLTANSMETVDVTFTYATDETGAEAKTRTVGSVPVQRNHRTNLYGALLTSNVDVNVEIKPGYDDDALEAWDGVTLNEPTYDDATKTYYISHAAELAYIAALVNGTLDTDNVTRAAVAANSLKNCTLSLECDINLNGKEWTPIGVGSKHFMGTLKGNNYTIHGLKISERPSGTSQAALFGTVSGSVTITDLTIKGAVINGLAYTDQDFYGSALIGTMYGNVVIKNVNVVDSYISGNNKVGALVAHDGVCSSFKVEGCVVDNCTFESTCVADGGLVGGLVGFFQGATPTATTVAPYGEHSIKNSHVKNSTFNVVNSTNTGKRGNSQFIGGIYSKANQVLKIDACSVANNTWNEKFYANGTEVTVGQYESLFVAEDVVWIGGERADNAQGKVVVNGNEIMLLQPIVNGATNEPYEGVALASDGVVVVTEEVGLVSLSAIVAADENNFAGKTVRLNRDIDLKAVAHIPSAKIGDSDAPIGSTGERDSRGRLICEPFKGTFDGNGKAIKNLYQSGWDMGYEWGQYGSIGLFSELDGATVKNLVVEGMEAQVEGGDIAFIAGSANGTCVFENITIKNSKIGTYNNGIGSIIGWSGAGHYTFKDITIESDVVLGGLWGSFDSSVGGIVGQAEPGATYNFENVTIGCRLDVYNDVTASYKYYIYRMCGMIIGRCQKTTTIDGSNYPDLSQYNITCNNVTVNYGDWMNYHYCWAPSLSYGCKRVEPGFTYGGVPADHDHSTCTEHNQCLPFDGLIGGDQYGVRPIKTLEGVTVNYPASYNPEN